MSKSIPILIEFKGNVDEAQQAIRDVSYSLQKLASQGQSIGNNIGNPIKELKAGFDALEKQIKTVKDLFLSFVSISWAKDKVTEIIRLADSWNLMELRLKSINSSATSVTDVYNKLFEASQRSATPIPTMVTLYQRLNFAFRNMGKSQEEAIKFAELLSKALRLSSSSALETKSVLIQLSQAFQSGILGGEEFRAVMENGGRVVQALTDGLNVSVGKLREMSAQGKLTSEEIYKALTSQAEKIDKEFSNVTFIVDFALTRVKNAFFELTHKIDENYKLTETLSVALNKLSDALLWVRDNFDTVAKVVERAFMAILVVLANVYLPSIISKLAKLSETLIRLGGSFISFSKIAGSSVSNVVTSLGKLQTGLAVIDAALIGWQIGNILQEKLESVRKFGVMLVDGFVQWGLYIQYVWESIKAVFTNDTIDAAYSRYQEKLRQHNEIISRLWKETGDVVQNESKRIGAAADGLANGSVNAMSSTADAMITITRTLTEASKKAKDQLTEVINEVKQRIEKVSSQINKLTSEVVSHVENVGKSYKGLTEIVDSQVKHQIEIIRDRYTEVRNKIEETSKSQAELANKATKALVDSIKQEMAIYEEAYKRKMQFLNEESEKRISVTKQIIKNEEERVAAVIAIETEILKTKKSYLEQIASEYARHIDKLNQETQRHLNEIKRIESEIKDLRMSTEDKIREMRRAALSEQEQLLDKEREAQEKLSMARKALAERDTNTAREYGKKYISIQQEIASEYIRIYRESERKRNEVEELYRKAREAREDAYRARMEGNIERAERYQQEAAEAIAKAEELRQQIESSIVESKHKMESAIAAVREGENLVIEALKIEKELHAEAAQVAITEREKLQQALVNIENKINTINKQLQEKFELVINVNIDDVNNKIKKIEELFKEKKFLIAIESDLEQARRDLARFEEELKKGKVIPIDLETKVAISRLQEFRAYAESKFDIELKASTEKAEATLNAFLEKAKTSLNSLQTISRHEVKHNVDQVAAKIRSLNGMNTSSTHTIYIQKVEKNFAGGPVLGFASGGAVPLVGRIKDAFAKFRRIKSGLVPGVGNTDSEWALLEPGSYVIRKKSVLKYGVDKLKSLFGFQSGGFVPSVSTPPVYGFVGETSDKYSIPKDFINIFEDKYLTFSKKKEIFENIFKFRLLEEYLNELKSLVGDKKAYTGKYAGKNMWYFDKLKVMTPEERKAEGLDVLHDLYRKHEATTGVLKTANRYGDEIVKSVSLHTTPSTTSILFFGEAVKFIENYVRMLSRKAEVLGIQTDWESRFDEQMAPIRDIIEMHENMKEIKSFTDSLKIKEMFTNVLSNISNIGMNFASGGSVSDTVPALLTPGEYVVSKEAVSKYGLAFLESINRGLIPVSFLQKVFKGFAKGGYVGDIATQPLFHVSKVIKVEFLSGMQKVESYIHKDDEAKFVNMLENLKLRCAV